MTDITSLVDKYGVYTYKDPLIYWATENFQNWKHRELCIQKDPLLGAYICNLDEEIFSEKPILTPDAFSTIEDEWNLEEWDHLFMRMFDAARTHSFCVVELYDEPPYWRVFTEREIEKIKYSKKGQPIGCSVRWTLELPKSELFINYDDELTFYDPASENDKGTALLVSFGLKKGNRLGSYDLEKLWTLAVDIRYINQDITNNSAKTSGFYHIVYGDSLKSAAKTELVNALDVAGSCRAVGAKESAIVEIRPIHPEQAGFSIDALITKMKQFASTSRLPLAFYTGERESGGVFTEGFTDEIKINKRKKFIFGQFKDAMMTLIKMRWGIELTDIEMYIAEEDMEQFEIQQQNEEENEFNNNKEKGSE